MKTRVIIASILLGVLWGIFLLRAASDHAADLNNSPIRQAVDLYKTLSGGELVGCATKFFGLGRQREAIVGGSLGVEPILPEFVQASAAVDAAQSQDVFGTRLGPEHS